MKLRLCMSLAAAGLLVLSACARQESAREIDWAKAALARNPDFEIIATDESAGIFTVRSTTTGRFETLKLHDLVAAPLPPKTVAQTAPPPATAEPVELPAAATNASGTLAADQTTGTPGAAPEAAEGAIAQGPGYSIHRGEDAPPSTASNLEGPGYSITRQEPAPGAEASGQPQAADSSVERRTDPIVCQGDRLMRIDGETIESSGDAVIAEKGCDLYISNANIRAGGVGIIARQARVHIVNSSIGGTRGSYEASEGAEIYVARTTLTGIGRRFDSATMNDLGGNAYQSN